jgi:myo-inositol-1(or 4)-monophosphatase
MKNLKSRMIELARILRLGGELILEGYTSSPGIDAGRLKLLSTTTKSSPKDLVTFYDKAVEDLLLAEFSKSFSGELVIGEESVSSSGQGSKSHLDSAADHFWLLDPIDGTTNFSRAYPFFCTTAAFVERLNGDYRVLLGAVYDPVHNEFFSAFRGGGSWLNFERMRVSQVDQPMNALLCTGFASERSTSGDRSFKLFQQLTKESLGVRRDGSAALDLAYVAAGRTDAYWEWGLSPWDIAAGICLVEESMGELSNLEGLKLDLSKGEILSSNGKLHKWLQNRIKEIT